MVKEFDTLYLSWRPGQGSQRFIVGVIKEMQPSVYHFRYNIPQAEKAFKEGFLTYTEFPDIHTEYKQNVLDIFAQRLIKNVRPDVQRFYDFWEIESDRTSDKFYLLGHTQGLLPTDNFEFLADYNIVPNLHFLTDLAGSSYLQLLPGELVKGDLLSFRTEPDNIHDSEAVYLIKDDKQIGYIKKIHCRIFHKDGAEKLKLEVKALDQNGIIKRVFVKVTI